MNLIIVLILYCHTKLKLFYFRSDKSPITSKRISNIIDYLTYEVWKYQVRGLYEEHKFLYTLLLTPKICLQSNRIKPNEFMTFIKGKKSSRKFIVRTTFESNKL